MIKASLLTPLFFWKPILFERADRPLQHIKYLARGRKTKLF